MNESNSLPCASWTDDCQGKKDYDGRLVSISTRYWPGSRYADGKPRANASIVLNHGKPDKYGYGDYTVLREQEFSGDSETDTKHHVEVWVKAQFDDIACLLGYSG
jgi:hypothetical protein